MNQLEEISRRLGDIKHQQDQFPNQIAGIYKVLENNSNDRKELQKLVEKISLAQIDLNNKLSTLTEDITALKLKVDGNSELDVVGLRAQVRDINTFIEGIKKNWLKVIGFVSAFVVLASIAKAVFWIYEVWIKLKGH